MFLMTYPILKFPFSKNIKSFLVKGFYLNFIRMFKCIINKVIVAHLNINSLRNKFGFLVGMVRSNVNILLISR